MSLIESNKPQVSGNLTCSVLDLGTVAPGNIIDRNVGFRLVVDWKMTGVGWKNYAGTWVLNAYVESMGPGPEAPLLTQPYKVAFDPSTPNYHWEHDFKKITPPVPPEQDDIPVAGVYNLVVVLTSLAPDGTPGLFAAFEELPMLQFYDGPT